MVFPNTSLHDIYRKEIELAVEKCYPNTEGNAFIGAGTLLFEIKHNPDKYPLFSTIKLERNKKLIITRVCVDIFKWKIRGLSGGASRTSAVYQRAVEVRV